jgi:hypothetical protein
VGFLGIGLLRRLLFPNMTGMSLEITEELIARQTPEAQAIIRALLATIQQLRDQHSQSPRNSSVNDAQVAAADTVATGACGQVRAGRASQHCWVASCS